MKKTQLRIVKRQGKFIVQILNNTLPHLSIDINEFLGEENRIPYFLDQCSAEKWCENYLANEVKENQPDEIIKTYNIPPLPPPPPPPHKKIIKEDIEFKKPFPGFYAYIMLLLGIICGFLM